MHYWTLMTLYNDRYDNIWDAFRAGDNSLKAIVLICLVAILLIISAVSASNQKSRDEKEENETVMAGINTVSEEESVNNDKNGAYLK